MPAKRGAPMLIALAAIGVVVLLVARPWGSDPVRRLAPPSPAAPSPAAVGATPAPGTRTVTSRPTARPLPSPDIAPMAPVGNYSIEFVSDRAVARCDYSRPMRGMRHLASMEVHPPVVLVDYPESAVGNIRSLRWSFELEMNRHGSMIDPEWETVARSRMQSTAAIDGRPTTFTPLTVSYDARGGDRTAVFRARVIVEWLTRNRELADRFESVATSYLEANDEFGGSWPGHCSGVRGSAR